AEEDRHRSRHALERGRARIAKRVCGLPAPSSTDRRLRGGWSGVGLRLDDPFAGRRIALFAYALVLQQRIGVVRAHRLAEVIALRIFAAELRELDRVRIGFGASAPTSPP